LERGQSGKGSVDDSLHVVAVQIPAHAAFNEMICLPRDTVRVPTEKNFPMTQRLAETEKERESERETERQREREKEREKERKRERERQTERERERERERQTERERERERETERERERERERPVKLAPAITHRSHRTRDGCMTSYSVCSAVSPVKAPGGTTVRLFVFKSLEESQ
jgi:hypothetical protein